jgi:hypothetical protein
MRGKRSSRDAEGRARMETQRKGDHMTITGSCHCGKIAFRIEGDIPAEAPVVVIDGKNLW